MDRPVTSLTPAEMPTEIQVARADRDVARALVTTLQQQAIVREGRIAELQHQVTSLQQQAPQPMPQAAPVAAPSTAAVSGIKVRLQRPEVTRDLKVIGSDSSTGTQIITVTD